MTAVCIISYNLGCFFVCVMIRCSCIYFCLDPGTEV